jgi:chemosensory pili system protein ChpA (sensor histidine kinase/response regulator)
MADKLILVVSDDSAVCDLASSGFPSDVELRFAHDARDARRVLEQVVPSAVVVDLQTGNAGGFALARDFRLDRRLAEVPIVMLLQRPQDAWLARQAGSNLFLTRPIEPGALASQTLALI